MTKDNQDLTPPGKELVTGLAAFCKAIESPMPFINIERQLDPVTASVLLVREMARRIECHTKNEGHYL